MAYNEEYFKKKLQASLSEIDSSIELGVGVLFFSLSQEFVSKLKDEVDTQNKDTSLSVELSLVNQSLCFVLFQAVIFYRFS